LWWNGANNEDDFDGYNVYGMKGKAADFGLEAGNSLQLLDAEGAAIQASRDKLALFNYDPAKGLNEVGVAVAEEGADAPEFSAFPIHTKDTDADKTPLLPTCKNDGAGKCVNTTKANLGKSAEDDGKIATNGPISYTITGLTVGTSYCFLVLSSIDAGQKVSAASSNFECIVPNYSGSFALDLPFGSTANNRAWYLDKYRDACEASKACVAPVTTTEYKVDGGDHYANDTDEVYVEYSSTGAGFVAGKNSGIADLGYYAGGFSDSSLPKTAPTLVIDSDTYDTGGSVQGPIFNEGGYSIAGQTVKLSKNHVYIIAVGDSAATGPVTEFLYFWIWIEGDVTTTSTASTVDVQVRMPFAAQ
jgi:hypothetical protein